MRHVISLLACGLLGFISQALGWGWFISRKGWSLNPKGIVLNLGGVIVISLISALYSALSDNGNS